MLVKYKILRIETYFTFIIVNVQFWSHSIKIAYCFVNRLKRPLVTSTCWTFCNSPSSILNSCAVASRNYFPTSRKIPLSMDMSKTFWGISKPLTRNWFLEYCAMIYKCWYQELFNLYIYLRPIVYFIKLLLIEHIIYCMLPFIFLRTF